MDYYTAIRFFRSMETTGAIVKFVADNAGTLENWVVSAAGKVLAEKSA